jgi:MFS transporter, AAHS family, 4-hydroxybenzoate transporter
MERVDVAEVIDRAPVGALQRRVLALCFLVSMLDGFDTQSIAFVAPAIAQDWGLKPMQFSLLFSATMAGTALGAALFGRVADLLGRRALIAASVTLFGLMSLGCTLSSGFASLLTLRLLAGIGLGGAIPNFIALASEYAPARARARLVVLTLWGFPFGAVVGGLASAPIIERFGWRAVFAAGGIAPLLLVFCLLRLLPESLRYLTLRARAEPQLVQLLRRIEPSGDFAPGARYVLPEAPVSAQRMGLLFKRPLAAGTLLLGAALFLSLLLSYLLVNWIPLLFRQLGLPLRTAVLGTVALNAGGIVGSYCISRLMDRTGRSLPALAASYVLAALVVAGMGLPGLSAAALLTITAGAGFFLIGNQMAVSAYIADYYPSALRATGLGVTQALGRCGSLLGPLVAGELLSSGAAAAQVFKLGAIPALGVVASLLVLRSIQPTRA